jgi:hypothetical protein
MSSVAFFARNKVRERPIGWGQPKKQLWYRYEYGIKKAGMSRRQERILI